MVMAGLPPQSGAFSKLLHPQSASSQPFKLLTWNARALAHSKKSLRRRKAVLIEQWCQQQAVIALQEVHGNLASLNLQLHRCLKTHTLFFNPHAAEDTGGTLFLVPKAWSEEALSTVPWSAVAGRAQRLAFNFKDSEVVFWNVHRHGLTEPEASLVCQHLATDRARAAASPLSSVLWATGDWNCLPGGEVRQRVEQPHIRPNAGSVTAHPEESQARLFNRTLESLVELEQPNHTHFCAKNSSTSRLDRIYSSMEGWMLLGIGAKMFLLDDPIALHRVGVSDHAPLMLVASIRQRLPLAARPIHPEVCRTKVYREKADYLARQAQLHLLPPIPRWQLHKEILKSAAQTSRNWLLEHRGSSDYATITTLASISRAVLHQDVRLATTLRGRSEVAQRFLNICGRRVFLLEPPEFQKAFDAARHRNLAVEAERLENCKRPSPGRIQTCHRLKKLWSTVGRRLSLQGIRCEGGRIVTSPEEQNSVLREHWSPVFTKKPHDLQAAEELVASVPRPPPPLLPFPSSDDIMRFLCFATSTAPGPDGLPYAAWAQAGPAAATTLWFMLGWHASGLQPPLVFNQSALVFPPKGTHEADEELVAREPENTRPISLKNTDSKTVTGMANWSAKGWVAKHMHPSQRGFTWKRQLLENVVEIDTCGRIEAMKALSRPPTASLVPCFSFWDYAAAFPSVHHFFVFFILQFFEFPIGFICMVDVVYSFVEALFAGPCGLLHFCWVTAGVLQGDPLSGLLFILCMHPQLHLFKVHIEDKGGGIARACADDIGAVLAELRWLWKYKPIFDLTEKAAGLKVKVKKCNIVPLVLFSAEIASQIKQWLTRKLPAWADFAVKPTADYLGFCMGPAAGLASWDGPLKKYETRSRMVKETRSAYRDAARLYNSRCLPVLSYVSQLLHPPRAFWRLESRLLHSMLHLPPNCLSYRGVTALEAVLPQFFRAANRTFRAAMLRTAAVTIPTWPRYLLLLVRAAEDCLPGALMPGKRHGPDFWEGPAMAANLAESFAYCPAGELVPGLAAHQDPLKKLGPLPNKELLGVQKLLTRAVFPPASPDLLLPTWKKRLKTLVDTPPELLPAEWTQLRKVWQKAKSGYFVACHIKMCIGGWTTSYRMHEPCLLSCRFGCGNQPDNMQHYFCCPALARLASGLLLPWPPSASSWFGCGSFDSQWLLGATVAFGTYHALRRDQGFNHHLQISELELACRARSSMQAQLAKWQDSALAESFATSRGSAAAAAASSQRAVVG